MSTAPIIDLQILRSRALSEAESKRALVREIGDTLHTNPEVAFEEHKSSEYLAEVLESSGFEVSRRYCGLPTSFKAWASGEGPGPTLALIAEYDALPVVGHGCGHNLIAAAAVVAAVALKPLLPEVAGQLVLIGAPAEESGGGKALLVERGGFDGVDAAMIVHPSHQSFVRLRSLAWEPVRISFRGKSSHASASPEKGINALNALIETFNSINALRQHVTSDVRIHGVITHGGEAPNVVPALATADFLIRAATVSYLKEVVEKVKRCAEGAALATGATLEFEITGPTYAPMKSNPPLEEAYARNMNTVGLCGRIEERTGGLGSTDVGNVSQVVPTVHPFFSISSTPIASHSIEFAQAAASDFAYDQTLRVAEAMALTCVDLWCDADLLARVKEAFARGGDDRTGYACR
ncbi:MAG: M20 family metallopeptidase [Firmicutes bacterium]|jgi:amidohydrolase|nr:M20 family metallopeptidase [Bacillota bacterium]